MLRKKMVNLIIGALALAALLSHARFAQAIWSFMPLENSSSEAIGGGVVHDIQIVQGVSGFYDDVWAVCMGGGVYSQISYTSGFGTWNEYQPGLGFLGLDAIKDANDYTHVMTGLRYANSNSGFPAGAWPYAGSFSGQWKAARIHDVAFHYESGWAANPQDEFFCMLNSDNISGVYPGIYRWYAAQQNFIKVYPAGNDPYYFSHFRRDISNPDVLYAIYPGDDYPGTIIKISGTYANPSAIPLTWSGLPRGAVVENVYDLNQWYDTSTSTLLTYVCAKYTYQSVDYYGVLITSGTPTDNCTVIEAVDLTREWHNINNSIDKEYGGIHRLKFYSLGDQIRIYSLNNNIP